MKNKIYSIIISITMLLMFSCNEKLKTSDDGYYFEDFDNLKMWSADVNVTTEQAHSGNYSISTDSVHEYSQTFLMNWIEINEKHFSHVNISGWALLPKGNEDVRLVCSFDDKGKPVEYKATDFISSIREPGKWHQIRLSMYFPENLSDSAKIKIYAWAPKKQKAFLDDIEIQFGK